VHPLSSRLAVAFFATMLAACGAKTGLRIFGSDAGFEDTGVPTPRCIGQRVRVPVGTPAMLHVDVADAPGPVQGLTWFVRSGPAGSMQQVMSTGGTDATFRPDVAGVFDIAVATPFALDDGGQLICEVTVTADPFDAACPNDPVIEPVRFDVPTSTMQFAFDPAYGDVRSNASAMAGILAADAPGDDVAALVMDVATGGASSEMFATTMEARIASLLGATPVLIGRTGTTPDMLPIRRSSFHVRTAVAATADVARDRIARTIAELNPGRPRTGFHASQAFVIEVTTLVRSGEQRATVVIAVASEDRSADGTSLTAIRVNDVANGTGLARRGRELDLACHALTTSRTLTADFLWLVDTSGSMDDDQTRIGDTSEQFFREMSAAGVDFRVGVIQAGGVGPMDLDDPGFAWISGTDPNGPRRLAFEVTHRRYHDDPMDRLAPYPLAGGSEEPVGAGVLAVSAMDARTSDPDDARRFRARATRAVFFASDEPGTNDDNRSFSLDPGRWGATPDARVASIGNWYRDHGILAFGLADTFVARACPAVENLIPCVTAFSGGAFIPLHSALDAEISAAISRIVDVIAAAGSEFALPRTPVSSSLRVRIDDRSVPRSRASGFDTDDTGRTVLFHGATYQPRVGQTVRAAFFTWR
jgi:hypothetical protein